MTEISDPKLVIKDLLVSEWNADNTPESSDPEIRTGWRDSDLTAPQVTASHDEESPTSPTGFSGMSAAGPTSTPRGTVEVNVWTRKDLTDANPKDAGHKFSEEVKRVLNEYGSTIRTYSGWTINGLDASNYRYLSYLGRSYMPDKGEDDDTPIEHRHRIVVGYEYLDR